MAPIVNGLEAKYEDQVDFIYLDVADPDIRPFMEEFGFEATPHFFMRAADGTITWSRQGAVSEAELIDQIDAVLPVQSDGRRDRS